MMARRLRFATLLGVLGAVALFHGPAMSFELQPGKVIGRDDLVAVDPDAGNLPENLRLLVDAIGWTNYGCTVFHIGKGLALTAGHCFEAKPDLITDRGCRFAEVEWGLRGGKGIGPISKCQKILAMLHNSATDFALIRVAPAPGARVDLDFSESYQPQRQVTILSHPGGMPLRWSQFCPLLVPVHDKTARERLHYECDTLGGSSGAPVIDALSAKVIGVHNGGWPDRNYGSALSEEPIKTIVRQAIQLP